MFESCCGRSQKTRRKLYADNADASCGDNNVINGNTANLVNCTKSSVAAKMINNFTQTENQTTKNCCSQVEGTTCSIIVNQPDSKRQSIFDQKSAEDYENDDVFCEGVEPVTKLANNLGTPFTSKKEPDENQDAVLPRWFSEEDEYEINGIQEPPATPIGKDELALRRHRFFSELLNASQLTAEHKVRFNPLGPVIAGDWECSQHSLNNLDSLISRLEIVTDRIENIYVSIHNLPKSDNNKSTETGSTANMSVLGFQEVLQGPFASYLVISQKIGGDVATHSALVEKAFQAQLQYLIYASQYAMPNQSDQMALLQPTSQHIGAIQDFREKHRTSPYFNHLSAISESIPALGWVTVSPAPAPYVKEMNDAGQFYTNRVLKDWKEKDKKHVEWVKAWVQTLTDLQMYVKQQHTTGLVWSGKAGAPAGPGVPPPPPGCPPPPPTFLDDVANLNINDERSALFAQINQGENITRSLKKVTSEMQTHKNPTLRTGPAPFKAPQTCPLTGAPLPVEKAPVFCRDGKKWLIEYQKGNHNLLVENAEMNNVVYLYKCIDSTVVVKGKINSITLDSCKKTSLVFDSVVSSVEFINCQSVQTQVLGKVPTISVDKTDGCQIYLSPASMDVEVVSSKSSEMNILVPKSNGDYTEYPVPEQYKTTVSSSGLTTIVVESKG